MAARRSSRSARVRSHDGWTLHAASAPTARRSAASTADPFVANLVRTGAITVEESREATQSARRSNAEAPLVVEFDATDSHAYFVVARHESGALTFSVGEPTADPRAARRRSRSAAARGRTLRFVIEARGAAPSSRRRGIAGKVIRFVVAKLVDVLPDVAIQKLAAAWEKRAWKKKGLTPGLVRITVDARGSLRPVDVVDRPTSTAGPCLLFLHGTFSDATGAFGALASTRGADGRTFFEAVRDVYGDRIYALQHFTVSRSPADNARDLLAELPDEGVTFDVVTHSRGALVLRSLADAARSTNAEDRFRLRHAVLVAGPNAGTPLASPERWSTLTDWLGNLIDLFPDNPFTLGLDFLVEALAWTAGKAGGVLPGLASMNPAGAFLRDLRALAPTGSLSALVADYEPDERLLARMLDVGVDTFFAEANDLVVPSAGGWRVSHSNEETIAGDRIGSFGTGGNLDAADVNHCSFFRRTETVDFLVRALSGKPSGLRPIDVTGGTFRRGGGSDATEHVGARGMVGSNRTAGSNGTVGSSGAAGTHAPDAERSAAKSHSASPPLPQQAAQRRASHLDEVLHLFVVCPEDAISASDSAEPEDGRVASESSLAATLARSSEHDSESKTAVLIASFRNARVIEPFKTKSGAAGERFRRIIRMHERIKGYVNGAAGTSLPGEDELRDYGALLFRTLFPGQVRRLFDSARSELKDRRLNVCFTSTIGWVADKPWEFAFDPSRESFLCTEQVNFTRNSLKSVAADALGPRAGRLRILVIAAQPIGAGELSIAEEEEKIRAAFRSLIEAGLADVRVVANATPKILHELLTIAEVRGEPYDILHFIGHGEFDAKTGFGYLLFESADGHKHELRADVFRQIVARRNLRLVFLNACETGMGFGRHQSGRRTFDFSRGIAPMLVSGGLPAIVANQFKVLDISATAFAQHFYWALAVGRTIGDAAREARVAVNYSIAGEAIDWAVPVLFARNPDDVLVANSDTPVDLHRERSGADPLRRRSVHRATRRRVAVWDMNYVVPGLERLIERLNAVQDLFAFETAEVAAPLGTWRHKTIDDDFVYLDAEEMDRKLAATATRLGVAHLCCVTNMPLLDRVAPNVATHLSSDGEMSIVSTFDLLRQLGTPDTTIDRLIANFLVTVLSGIEEHRDGVKPCPQYTNEERDIRWFAGTIAFCGPCRERMEIARRLDVLDALDRILTAFPP